MEHLETRQKITIMIAVMASLLFAALNQTIVGTVMPRIVSDLGGIQYFNWVFTIFMLTASVTTVLVGKLSDIYGRKIFILTGLALFMIGSFLCGTAQTMIQLIIWRGLQGFGGGMVMATAFTAVGDLFSPRERGRWQGLMGAVFGLASVLGPTLGGYIVDHFDWHWVFWIFLPVGLIAFYLILRLFPQTPRGEKNRIDYTGSIFLVLTIVPLLLAFTWAGDRYTWTSWQILSMIAVSAFSLAAFIWVEKHAENPVMPLHLFKNSIFTLSNVINFLIGVAMFGATMYAPFYIQGVKGISAAESGVIMMAMTLGMVLASSIVGSLVTKTGKYKKLALGGLLVMGAGMVLLSMLTIETSILLTTIYLIIVGLGLGTAFPIFNLTVQNAVSHRYLGVSTSAIQLFRQMGGTIGVSIMGTIMISRMDAKIAATPAPPELANNPAAQTLANINPQVLLSPDQLAAIRSQLPAGMEAVFDQVLLMLREAMNAGISSVFIVGGAVITLAFLCTFFLREIPLRTSNEEPPQEDTGNENQTSDDEQASHRPTEKAGAHH
ncbi:MDR family MFS transporter [Desmospora activa]|uniref:EmrB/QacA subfamily drug resistance transporter n=1 Tax=Desmospora activa DSM 45169 TaxID=1121389 RepID=A0A2T4Z8A8_9BACL|nr:MDR family MFS transporter [Desmospora activa]PTM58127.1 EmrB/QacA subfamily drug resistance transporter [Desmospora activa DSM 45169]